MWSVILKGAAGLISLVNKFIPSREEKAGRAMSERDNMKESADAKKRIDAVLAPSERDTTDSLRRHDF